jgi:hypothetical protein
VRDALIARQAQAAEQVACGCDHAGGGGLRQARGLQSTGMSQV